MRKLIVGIIISLLAILLGATVLVGLMVLLFTGLIILGLLIASPFIMLHYARNHRLGPVFGWTALVVVVMTIIGFGILWWRMPASVPRASTASTMVQPVERWVCEWRTSPNESRTFEAKIDKCDSESLWFSTPYMCGGTMKMATYMLAKSGDSFAGSWSQNSPKDSGTLFLKKDGNQRYIGQITDEKNKTAIITLERK